jgi:hypothetical protein
LHAFATEFPEYELAVSETSHRASGGESTNGYPNSIQGQADFMKDVIRACNDTINNACNTMLVWEPVMWQTMFTRIGNTQYYQANDSTRVFHVAFSEYIQKSNVYLATKRYQTPTLPDTVEVLDVKNNKIVHAAVNWNSVPEEAYSKLGSFTVTGTTEFGDVSANVTVIMDVSVLEKLMNSYIESQELSGPLVAQLMNTLKQADHHMEKGSTKDAMKFIEKYISILDRNTNDKHISSNAKNNLKDHAQLLIETWSK